MSTELVANEELTKKAVSVIVDALVENGIPKLEGGCAMAALLKQLADEGLDVRVERKYQA